MKDFQKTSKDGGETAKSITAILPHREPFLFLSRIVKVENGRLAVAEYDVPEDHPFFQGHFPQEPVFPGVIILEMMAQTGALAVLNDPNKRGRLAYLAGIESARFKRPVRPGQTLRAETEIETMRMGIGKARAKAFVKDEEVASAKILFALGV